MLGLGNLPKVRGIIPPSTGWKPHTYYQVLISHRSTNPLHYAILYTGFLTDGQPSAYSKVWEKTAGTGYVLDELYALHTGLELFSDSLSGE